MTADLRSSRAYQFHRILWQAIDWIYPPRCAGCSAPGFRFCASCASRVKTIDQGKVCPLCGVPQPTSEVCPECRSYTPAFTAVRSWGLYEGTLREAIHHLKYRSDLGVSEELARPLGGIKAQMAVIYCAGTAQSKEAALKGLQPGIHARPLGSHDQRNPLSPCCPRPIEGHHLTGRSFRRGAEEERDWSFHGE